MLLLFVYLLLLVLLLVLLVLLGLLFFSLPPRPPSSLLLFLLVLVFFLFLFSRPARILFSTLLAEPECYKALFDHAGTEGDELTFSEGDLIMVEEKSPDGYAAPV